MGAGVGGGGQGPISWTTSSANPEAAIAPDKSVTVQEISVGNESAPLFVTKIVAHWSPVGIQSWAVPLLPLGRVPVVEATFECVQCHVLPFQPSPHESYIDSMKHVRGAVGLEVVGEGEGEGVAVGALEGAAPWQYPNWHTSLTVNGSLSSHVVPSAYTEHRPVAKSQVPPGIMHGLMRDAVDALHPTDKQSPITISSRAKSPV